MSQSSSGSPGEYVLRDEDIICNEDRRTVKIVVRNHGDRAIQVGSHFHFFEVNKVLEFPRELAYGMRLNIPAGTAVRFEPGEEKEVELVEISGRKKILGFNALTNGYLETARKSAFEKAVKCGFRGAYNESENE